MPDEGTPQRLSSSIDRIREAVEQYKVAQWKKEEPTRDQILRTIKPRYRKAG